MVGRPCTRPDGRAGPLRTHWPAQRGQRGVAARRRSRTVCGNARVTGQMGPAHDPLAAAPAGRRATAWLWNRRASWARCAGRRQPVEDGRAGAATGADRRPRRRRRGPARSACGQVALGRLPICLSRRAAAAAVGSCSPAAARSSAAPATSSALAGSSSPEVASSTAASARRTSWASSAARAPSTRWCSRSSRAAEKERYQPSSTASRTTAATTTAGAHASEPRPRTAPSRRPPRPAAATTGQS